MMHMKNTCWPAGGEIRVVRDSVTQTLVLVTMTLSAAAMVILWLW